ncbi:hypothetical protein B0H65DRAFT_465635 [Neurospora tetraspora]|uniref:Uncharacterized protein n=1 Tax=Neurospora tetraspora TaxID=94610 RepID=A0AAE0JFN6_9PEZI|nr:hypothetical protein B0H65DRAFT_465635 [Neurospora tetraspora]
MSWAGCPLCPLVSAPSWHLVSMRKSLPGLQKLPAASLVQLSSFRSINRRNRSHLSHCHLIGHHPCWSIGICTPLPEPPTVDAVSRSVSVMQIRYGGNRSSSNCESLHSQVRYAQALRDDASSAYFKYHLSHQTNFHGAYFLHYTYTAHLTKMLDAGQPQRHIDTLYSSRGLKPSPSIVNNSVHSRDQPSQPNPTLIVSQSIPYPHIHETSVYLAHINQEIPRGISSCSIEHHDIRSTKPLLQTFELDQFMSFISLPLLIFRIKGHTSYHVTQLNVSHPNSESQAPLTSLGIWYVSGTSATVRTGNLEEKKSQTMDEPPVVFIDTL